MKIKRDELFRNRILFIIDEDLLLLSFTLPCLSFKHFTIVRLSCMIDGIIPGFEFTFVFLGFSFHLRYNSKNGLKVIERLEDDISRLKESEEYKNPKTFN